MKRSKQNLSHYHLTTGEIGDLIPAQWTEVLPGDSIRASTSVFARATPLLAPVMHPISMRIHHFFVPNRILDDNWEKFITQQDTNLNTPTTVAGSGGRGLHDYLGLPPQAAGKTVNAFPVLAYDRIFADYYRDHILEPDPVLGSNQLRTCMYEKDYITASRPEPTVLPNERTIPISVPNEEMTVSDLRETLARYRFDEARARFGNRYTEYLQYLGIKPSDARLQRAEYLGGGSAMINFSEVLQTVDQGSPGDPLGKLGGHGVAGLRTRPFTKFFEEHGIFMTMLSLRPKAIYTSGVAKEWLRFDWDDYWQKELQYEGQEPVLTGEVYSDNTLGDDLTFGYQDRHYSYRRGISRVSQGFRTAFDYWHLARQFTGHPGLTGGFIRVEPAFNRRIFADQTNDGFYFAINNKIVARRLVTNNPTPRIV